MLRFSPSRLRTPLFVAGGLLVMAGLLAWLLGAFRHRLPPGPAVAAPPSPPAAATHTVTRQSVPRHETAVGTVRAVRETQVASRVLGRLKTLHIVRAGQPVQQGDLLAEIEAGDLQAMAEAARAAVQAATTRAEQARVDLERSQALQQQGIAAGAKVTAEQSALAAATAEVERARQSLAAAESALGFATIRAPLTGVVVDKQVNPGDVVQPGQPICTIYDPTQLQLVAVVREELAGRLRTGQAVEVTLDALGKQCQGTVSEVVPAADSRSRAFEVKVTGPCQPGIVTGMFGRLLVPLEPVAELRVPLAAVQSVGQLDFVQVVQGGQAHRRFVRLGERHGDQLTVLSGLTEGETVALLQPR